MKKIQTLLSIAILVLLHNSAWGMEKESSRTGTRTKVVVPKGKYHDGTKSWFGSGENTLDHLGEKFLNQEYGPGSDDETESRWKIVGKRISKPNHAMKLLKLAEERQWHLSEQELERLKNLVTTEQQPQQDNCVKELTKDILSYAEVLKKNISE